VEISPALGLAIMTNNYAHDVAAALLATSAFVLHAIVRVQVSVSDPAGTRFFIKTYDMMARYFRFALWWIVIGGIPRTIFFRSFEWNHFADKLQIPALILKHLLIVVLVIWGIFAWRRLKLRVALLRASLGDDVR
jgi:hypothetical protein